MLKETFPLKVSVPEVGIVTIDVVRDFKILYHNTYQMGKLTIMEGTILEPHIAADSLALIYVLTGAITGVEDMVGAAIYSKSLSDKEIIESFINCIQEVYLEAVVVAKKNSEAKNGRPVTLH